MTNKLGDLFGLLKVIKCEPWCSAKVWKNLVVKSDDDMASNVRRCNRILRSIMVRRTMKSRDSETGKLLIELPPISSEIVKVNFLPNEREFYEQLFERCSATFSNLVKEGKASTSMIKFLSLLMKLRQTCASVEIASGKRKKQGKKIIVNNDDNDNDKNEGIPKSFMDALMKNFNQPNSSAAKNSAMLLTGANECEVDTDEVATEKECSVCLESIQRRDLVVTPCAHTFHRACIVENQLKTCPECREEFDYDDLMSAKNNDINNDNNGNGTSSSKLGAILFELKEIWRKNDGEKILLFSQFIEFLDLVEENINNSLNAKCFRIDGSKSLEVSERSERCSKHSNVRRRLSMNLIYFVRTPKIDTSPKTLQMFVGPCSSPSG